EWHALSVRTPRRGVAATRLRRRSGGQGGRRAGAVGLRAGGFLEDLFGKVDAGTTAATAAGAHGQLAHAAHALRSGLADSAVGHGIADADIHAFNSPTRPGSGGGGITARMRMIVNRLRHPTAAGSSGSSCDR